MIENPPEWQRVEFDTEAEARAFADGLTYGDEPVWYVDEVSLCAQRDGHWDVWFCYRDELS